MPATLDYETNPQYNLTITVSDPGDLIDVQDVTINLSDVNEAPVIQNLPDSIRIFEDVVGKRSLFTVSTIDQDIGDVIAYSIVATPSSAPFEIDNTGIYFVKSCHDVTRS